MHSLIYCYVETSMKKILAALSIVALLTPSAFAADAATVNASALNVRADADLTADILGKLPNGAAVSVEGKVLKDKWCRISYKNQEAYVSCEFLTFTNAAPAATTPAATTPVTTTPAIATAPATTTTPAATATGTTMTTAPVFPLDRVVTVPTLNVRSSGALTADVLGKLSMGASVSVLEKSTDNWCRIEFSGKVGWIACMYLAKADATATAPAATAPATTTPATTATGTTMPTTVSTTSPGTGCSWQVQDFGSLTLQVKQCANQTAYKYGVRANGIYKYTSSIDTSSDPILELYSKGEDEPVQDAIMSLVAGTIPQDEKGKCVVRKAPSDLSDASKELYALVPTDDYQKIVDARMANETNVTACGEYGIGKVKQYFEYHPAESKVVFAFVRADGSFDLNAILIRS